MATATQADLALLSMEEYLSSSYHPDCDYVDGHLEERTLGSTPHGKLQLILGFWFYSHQDDWNLWAMGDVRTRVSETRVRLPDVAVVLKSQEVQEPVQITPPFIAIEILSPDDRMNRVLVRLGDFLAMGVPNVWLLDPQEKVAYTYSEGGLKLVKGPRLPAPDSPIYLDLPEIFRRLD